MTNGELVASSINKIVAGIRKAGYTDVRPVFWDDMLNPMHLHGKTSDQDNLQAQHYGREDGTLDTAMRLVEDKSIIWCGPTTHLCSELAVSSDPPPSAG